jgi:uncharacterized protein (UPF0335 family)
MWGATQNSEKDLLRQLISKVSKLEENNMKMKMGISKLEEENMEMKKDIMELRQDLAQEKAGCLCDEENLRAEVKAEKL